MKNGFTREELQQEAIAVKQVNYSAHHIKYKMRVLAYAAHKFMN